MSGDHGDRQASDIRVFGGLAGNGTVINGLAGNDITTNAGGVRVASGASYGAGISVNAAGGADSINLVISGSTQSASNPIVLGGAGRDTITISGGLAANAGTIAQLGGGDGGDLITIGTGSFSAIGGGAGLDTIELVSGASILTGSTLGAGAGNDGLANIALLTGAALLGGGNDTITVSGFNGPGASLNGDPPPMAVASMSSTSKLKVLTPPSRQGGADIIRVSNIGASGVIAGNYGKDVIAVGVIADEFSIKGGAGGDSITVVTGGATESAALQAAVTTPSPCTPPRATSPESSTTLVQVSTPSLSLEQPSQVTSVTLKSQPG